MSSGAARADAASMGVYVSRRLPLLARALRRAGRRLARERGVTLSEMLVTMSILGIVIGGITTLFVSGTNAEVNLNNRFQAQQAARLSLDELRRQGHCSDQMVTPAATPTGSIVQLHLPSQCTSGTGWVTWCFYPNGNHYTLYEETGQAPVCTTTGRLYADNFVVPASPPAQTTSFFTYTAPQPGVSLAKLHVELPVNPRGPGATGTYLLEDDIVLRNSTR